MMTSPFIVFIDDADEYDVIQLKHFVNEKLGARARLCRAEDIYVTAPGDDPRARRIGQRAVELLS